MCYHCTTEQLYYFDNDSKRKHLAKDDGWAHAAGIEVNFPVQELQKKCGTNVHSLYISELLTTVV